MTEPVFILSAPRVGSTLLQRILATHTQISTSPEPYLLLPIMYAFKEKGIFGHYYQRYVAKGLSEFCDCLPDKKQTYYDALSVFTESLYEKAAKGNRYFLDKTPANALIAPEIFKIFPERKFIVLVRNPVAAISSAIELWGQGKWRLFIPHDHMVLGLKILLDAAVRHRDRICLVNFEKLVANPEQEIRRISNFLELDFEPDMVSGFTKVSFKGKMGDPTADKYSKISTAPQEKWKKVMNTPLRKAWIKRYLDYLGSENLKEVGYDVKDIMDEVRALPNDFKKFAQDLFEMPRDMLKIRFKKFILQRTSKYL